LRRLKVLYRPDGTIIGDMKYQVGNRKIGVRQNKNKPQ
jgi:hypothetical protein